MAAAGCLALVWTASADAGYSLGPASHVELLGEWAGRVASWMPAVLEMACTTSSRPGLPLGRTLQRSVPVLLESGACDT